MSLPSILAFYVSGGRRRNRLVLSVATVISFWAAMFAASMGLGQDAVVDPKVTAADSVDVSDDTARNSVSPDQVTSAKIIDLQGQVEGAADLDEDAKAKIANVISQAAEELNRAAKLDASAKQNRILTQTAQSRLETIQKDLAEIEQTPLDLPPASASLTDLESSLAQRMANLQELKNSLSSLQAELSRRLDRRKQIATLQASLDERTREAERQLTSESPAGESNWLTSARRMLQLAKLQSLALEPSADQWELARYDAEAALDLPSQKINLAQAELDRVEASVAALNDRINNERKSQARGRVEQLRDLAELIEAPEQKALAIRNAELAEENEGVVNSIGLVAAQTDAMRQKLESLNELDQRTRRRVDRVGLSGAIGLELRKQLSLLPDVRDIRRQSRSRQDMMRDVEMKRLSHEDALMDLSGQPVDPDASGLEKKIRADYSATLASLTSNYDRYFQQLSELDFNEKELIDATQTYRSFLDEHVLWIRSDRFFDWISLKRAFQELREVSDPRSWADVGRSLWVDSFEQPWLYGLALIALLLLMPARYRGRSHVIALGKTAERPTCTEFSVTVRAALMTIIMAVVWPAVLVFFGWRLTVSPMSSVFAIAVGRGLISTGIVLTLLNVVRHSCRRDGLADAHFGWPTRVTELLRSKMRQARLLLLPFVFLVVMLSELGGIANDNGLQRICMVASLIILGWALQAILNPRQGAIAETFHRYPDAWVTKTAGMWTWAIIGFPLLMAVLIVIGFRYTASELTWRFWHTMWTAVSLIAVRAFAIRALQINHRKVRIRKLKERRATAAQVASEKQTSGEKPIIEPSPAGDALTLENEHDALRANSEQVIRILHSGLLMTGLLLMWFLWSSLFPAFGILDQVTLWQTEREVAIETPLADGSAVRATELRVEPVTPINLLAAMLIGLVTFTLVRNVPGLIEITILQRLPLEASFKFAIVTMCRYAILVIGLLLAFSAIGASWSKLQWLVAALTVGLGFGLQEIFGNFVSGIIILWERPVRLGDVVTLDGVSGTVSRIQMRATTISDWDRKEYIVPNKDFVTGRLLNWTRSDQVSRIVISVGIAYGSDVRSALGLLIQIANDHPRILDDPPISATFDGFGDSTLNLSLRCFVPNLDGRLETISELNLAIDDAFAASGIEIAFPQQDLHIRSVPPSWSNAVGNIGSSG